MSIFYIDLVNGNDSNDGTSWANAWKTITNGATAARIAPGDTIRVSKTPDPVSIGNGKWTLNTNTGGRFPATKSITATANNGSGLIRITVSSHGYSTGDVIQIMGLLGTFEANGAWVITYVDANNFDLDGSVYINARTSGGTAQLVNSKAIVLATANTLNIDRCQAAWSNGVDGTSYVTSGTKDGAYGVYCTLDSTPNGNTVQSYKTIGTLDLSTYQYLSFWIKNPDAISNNTTWKITLCSDTAGATPVDTFVISAIQSTSRWLPLTIAREGGGNLGSTIQSIAINTGSTPAASTTLYLSNIIATKTNGINLQSLISKNSSAQGGTGAFYGIQSINGKVVLVDNDTNTLSNAGRGYYETSETCTTYIRETFKTPLAASSSTVVSEIMDSGTLGNLIAYEFGFEVGTTNQNGETFLDGLNGKGSGIYLSSKNYISLNWINTVRYNNGINLEYGTDCTIINMSNANNNTGGGVYLGVMQKVVITSLENINNNYIGLIQSSNYSALITKIVNSNNNVNYGIYFSASANNTITELINCRNNGYYGLYIYNNSSNNIIETVNTSINNSSAISSDTGINFLRNASIQESTQVTGIIYGAGMELWSIKEDGVEGNNWGYFYGSTYNWQTDTKHGTEPGAGKISITSADRKSNYKVPLKIAEIACEADKLVTFKAWVKKDHATNVACQLRVDTDAVTGVTGTTTVKANDTDWEELTLTFTPDIRSVVEVYFDSWYVSGTSNTYVGTVTITQAP